MIPWEQRLFSPSSVTHLQWPKASVKVVKDVRYLIPSELRTLKPLSEILEQCLNMRPKVVNEVNGRIPWEITCKVLFVIFVSSKSKVKLVNDVRCLIPRG